MDELFLSLLIPLQSSWLTPTLLFCSRFDDHLCDGFCDLLPVTMSQGLAIGRIHWKPFGPVELLRCRRLFLSFTQSTMPLMVFSPASFPSRMTVKRKGSG